MQDRGRAPLDLLRDGPCPPALVTTGFPAAPKASEVNHLLLPTFNSLCSRADLADRLPGVVVLLDALKQPREVAYEDDSSSDLEEPFMTSPPKNGYQPSTKQSCAHRAGETHQSRTILLHTSR